MTNPLMNEDRRPRPDAVLIAGPTASGKSGLAIDVAQALEGEIINADSMQLYRDLRVLTARPDETEMAGVAHHLYGHVAASENRSVAQWVEEASSVADSISGRGKVPIFIGGTGLYFRALEQGLAQTPPVPEALRDEIRSALRTAGSDALHERLAQRDPEGAAFLRSSDGQRIARALEVVEATGRPLAFWQAQAGSRAWTAGRKVLRLLIMLERPILHQRIEARARLMLDGGAIAEVEALMGLDLPRDATIRQAIGVRQIADFLVGAIGQDDMLRRLQAATRQYAKRQCTWFRGQLGPDWQVANGPDLHSFNLNEFA